MSILVVAAMMLAQAPAAAKPDQPVTVKAKPKQICEMVEVTGSRSKRRVCRDATGNLDLGPGVSNSAYGKARLDQQGLGTGGQSIAH
jgi:hypothetical protein